MKKSILKFLSKIIVVAIFALNISVFFLSADAFGNNEHSGHIEHPNMVICDVGYKIPSEQDDKPSRYCGDCGRHKVAIIGDGTCRLIRY